jgi:cytochrome c-type biogenesis protein CcmH/NrfF
MRVVRMLSSRWATGLLLICTLLMGAAGGFGQTKNYDPGGKRFDRLGHNLVCMCGCGQIMMECNHVGCSSSEKMRQELKAAIDRGESDQQILAGFVTEYGPVVLAAPTHSGFNLVAWIMPVVMFIAGLGAVALVVIAWKRRSSKTPPADTPGGDSGTLDEFRRRAREETSF